MTLLLAPGTRARTDSGGNFDGYTPAVPPVTRTAPFAATPITRGLAPRPSAATHTDNQRSRSDIDAGILGGVLGIGLGSLLFGHAFGGTLEFTWLLVRLLIVFLVVRWIWRRLGGGTRFAFAGLPNGGNRPTPVHGVRQPSARRAPPLVPIEPEDFQRFERILYAVQDAWSRADLTGLARLGTPEMVSYFSEQLSGYASRGFRNTLAEVRLQKCDLAQSWRERGRDYATVAMCFGMIDVTRDQMGHVVDGSPDEHVTATELWTFSRASGDEWLLSAIQQAQA